MLLQSFYIVGAASSTANAIDLDGEARETQRKKELLCNIYNFGIEGGVSIPQGFETKLVVLPLAASLWSLVSEGRSNIVKSHRLGQVV